MSDLKKDVQAIEEFLSQKSIYGNFTKKDEPEFEYLCRALNKAGVELAKAQELCTFRELVMRFHNAKLDAFIHGIEIDKTLIEAIEEKIAIYIEQTKQGGK
ncbi:hypothetical protein [Dipodfec virus UA06Rod_21]|uniref:Uncharacterized protein n=1 Tax=Dipodfec virus UA06Rod_21 TaxID=2929321 RepID=A0A976N2N2_9VIRU|nr:hypothetical protein [Dipodfec virus UA06Rod_21]